MRPILYSCAVPGPRAEHVIALGLRKRSFLSMASTSSFAEKDLHALSRTFADKKTSMLPPTRNKLQNPSLRLFRQSEALGRLHTMRGISKAATPGSLCRFKYKAPVSGAFFQPRRPQLEHEKPVRPEPEEPIGVFLTVLLSFITVPTSTVCGIMATHPCAWRMVIVI